MKEADSEYLKKAEKREKNREYQAACKKRKRDAGLVPVEVWIQPDMKYLLTEFADRIRDARWREETPKP